MPSNTWIESGLAIYLLNVGISTLAMWAAAKLTALHASLTQIAVAMLGAALVGLLPGFWGWLASIMVLFGLLRYLTEAPVFPGIALMVVVSRILWALVYFTLL